MWVLRACLQWLQQVRYAKFAPNCPMARGPNSFMVLVAQCNPVHVFTWNGNAWQIPAGPNTTNTTTLIKINGPIMFYHPGILTTSNGHLQMPHCARDSIGIWTCGFQAQLRSAVLQENDIGGCRMSTDSMTKQKHRMGPPSREFHPFPTPPKPTWDHVPCEWRSGLCQQRPERSCSNCSRGRSAMGGCKHLDPWVHEAMEATFENPPTRFRKWVPIVWRLPLEAGGALISAS